MKAIILLSGGIDSCVVLSHALLEKKACIAISFHYGQRHACELEGASKIAAYYGINHRIFHIDPSLFSGSTESSLTNRQIQIDARLNAIHPNTYVPCRNLVFLSHAASFAESIGASEIYFGAHANDGPSYPDCRPSFFHAFTIAVEQGSYLGQSSLKIICPLITFDKRAVIDYGRKLSAPLHLTWSCYDPQEGKPCTKCPACILRASAFSSQ
jgi:7-cyano-7-deazaguanine synthase